uniref:ShKT domain-containing protein n=1 Tax=Branchiostoma floridae TaxID=7739 RepID=C3ZP82_BRAFL|eukprot:XP_002589568.1 hypothetical protein BRAFLDRAFT_81525 [Branchiostoma floridae]
MICQSPPILNNIKLADLTQNNLACSIPIINHISPTAQQAKVGETAIFYCNATGFNRPKITWSWPSVQPSTSQTDRPHDKVRTTSLAMGYNSAESSLTITHVQMGDQGHYTCHASNAEGEDSMSLFLTVISDTPPVPHVAPAVGGAVGAVVLCTILGLICFVHKQRQQIKEKSSYHPSIRETLHGTHHPYADHFEEEDGYDDVLVPDRREIPGEESTEGHQYQSLLLETRDHNYTALWTEDANFDDQEAYNRQEEDRDGPECSQGDMAEEAAKPEESDEEPTHSYQNIPHDDDYYNFPTVRDVLILSSTFYSIERERARSCQDNNANCGYWAGIGECQANPNYMLSYCQLSCNVCPTGLTSECVSQGRGCALDTWECNQVTNVPYDVRSSMSLDYFYQKYLHAYGIPILGSSVVPDEALRRACYDVLFLLADRKDLRDSYYDYYGRAAIMAETEVTLDIPEHSDLDVSFNTRARGLGATVSRPVSTGAEENVLCYSSDRYRSEDIFLHEFSHGIDLLGARQVIPDWRSRLQAAYNSARAAGLWANTYADDTIEEYFAEGVQAYFDVNAQSLHPNGIHNHVNSRAELEAYDPALYLLIQEIFPCGNTLTKRCDPVAALSGINTGFTTSLPRPVAALYPSVLLSLVLDYWVSLTPAVDTYLRVNVQPILQKNWWSDGKMVFTRRGGKSLEKRRALKRKCMRKLGMLIQLSHRQGCRLPRLFAIGAFVKRYNVVPVCARSEQRPTFFIKKESEASTYHW